MPFSPLLSALFPDVFREGLRFMSSCPTWADEQKIQTGSERTLHHDDHVHAEHCCQGSLTASHVGYAHSNILLCDTVLVLRASNNTNVWKRLLCTVQPPDCVKLLTTSSFSHDHRRWRELRSDSEGLCRRKHRSKLPLIRAQSLRLIIKKREHLICHFILFILYLVLGKYSSQRWK